MNIIIGKESEAHSICTNPKFIKKFSYLGADGKEQEFDCPDGYEIMLEEDGNNIYARIDVQSNGSFDGLRIDINSDSKTKREYFEKVALAYAKLYIEQSASKIINF